jgi:hypothetical protein
MEEVVDDNVSYVMTDMSNRIRDLVKYKRVLKWFDQYSEEANMEIVDGVLASSLSDTDDDQYMQVRTDLLNLLRCLKPLMVSAKVVAYLKQAASFTIRKRSAIFVGKSLEKHYGIATDRTSLITVAELSHMMHASDAAPSSNAAPTAYTSTENRSIRHNGMSFVTTIADVKDLMKSNVTDADDEELERVDICLQGVTAGPKVITLLKQLLTTILKAGISQDVVHGGGRGASNQAVKKKYYVFVNKDGSENGRYSSTNGPAAAAKKAATRRFTDRMRVLQVTVRETGTQKRFSYTATRTRLPQPLVRQFASGEVRTQYKIVLKAIKR